MLFSFSLSSVSFPSKLSSPLRSAKKIFIIYSSKVSEILCESLILLSSTINFSSKKLSEASLSLSGVGTRTILSLSTSLITYFSTSTSLGNAIQSSTYLIYFSIIAIRFLRSGCLPTLVLNVLNKSIKDFRSYWETPKYFSVWTLISTSTATPNELTSDTWCIFLTISTIWGIIMIFSTILSMNFYWISTFLVLLLISCTTVSAGTLTTLV